MIHWGTANPLIAVTYCTHEGTDGAATGVCPFCGATMRVTHPDTTPPTERRP